MVTLRLPACLSLLVFLGCVGLSLPDPPGPGRDGGVSALPDTPTGFPIEPPPVGVIPLGAPRVESPTAPQSAPRAGTLRLRYDRPLVAPCPRAAVLARGTPTPAQALALSRSLPSTAPVVAVEVACTDDLLGVRPVEALDPATVYTLVVTEGLRGADGAAPQGTTPFTLSLKTLPSPEADPVLALGPVAAREGFVQRIWVLSDRPVALPAGLDRGWTLHRLQGEVAMRAALDCLVAPALGRCVRLEAREGGPVAVGGSVRLEVAPGAVTAGHGRPNEGAVLTASGGAAGAAPGWGVSPLCAAAERGVSPLCVDLDDRALTVRGSVTAPGWVHLRAESMGQVRSSLTAVEATWAARVATVAPGQGHGLVATLYGLDGRSLAALRVEALAVPGARGHLRITEVLARPAGVGRQEFVELFNDGAGPLGLDGYVLALGTGRSVFPAGAVVPGGGFVVLAGAMFDPRGDSLAGDPALAAGAILVRWSGTLGGRGLRDAGSRVAVLDPTGRVESEHPGDHPGLVPRAGVGVVRGGLELEESDPAGWAYDPAGRSTPGR